MGNDVDMSKLLNVSKLSGGDIYNGFNIKMT